MPRAVEIENIEAMRQSAGIDDAELRKAIRALRVGDVIMLTLLAPPSPAAGETLAVRITRIEGNSFRGKLTRDPAAAGLSQLRAGSSVCFTRNHIHSIPKWRASDD